jgi:hypothetical protein
MRLELGPEAEVLAELRERVRQAEVERTAERRHTGGRVCGRRGVAWEIPIGVGCGERRSCLQQTLCDTISR